MGNNKYKILIIEDDRSICGFLDTTLQAAGYQVVSAHSAAQGQLVFSSHQPDLIILDLGLPDLDGMELLARIRSGSSVPILILSARMEEHDKVTALDMGANDYITKPFSNGELLARIRAALRISRQGLLEAPCGKFVLEDLEIDYDRRLVSVSGQTVHMTQTEYNILALLSRHTGRVLTYSSIIRDIWGSMDEGSIKKLQVNMANIRKKLGVRPGENRYIANELGVGYRMLEENL